MTAPLYTDPRFQAAADRWGDHPWDWPRPIYREPRWWEFSARRNDRYVREVFGEFDRKAFWAEIGRGQSVYEDCGGYLLRCYRAMIGLPVGEVYSYEDVARDLFAGEG